MRSVTPHRILLVDDEPHVVCVLRLNLEQAGHTVLSASNGEDAYAIACAEQPDLIVTDYQMPGGGGIELATRLFDQKITRSIPIVLVTARAHHLDDAVLAKTNISEVVDKPFSPRQLMATIESLLATGKPRKSDAA
ncbi:MAG: response regulator [Phycisphaerales bacterium]|nr:response regulator [Phycisphaerales bacterium]